MIVFNQKPILTTADIESFKKSLSDKMPRGSSISYVIQLRCHVERMTITANRGVIREAIPTYLFKWTEMHADHGTYHAGWYCEQLNLFVEVI